MKERNKNMKKLLIFAVSFAAINAIGESLYVPASSDIYNNNYILKEGELVYKTVDNTFTSLVVGNGTRRPYYVSDERALKCQNIYQDLDESVLVIEKSDNVTYEDGTYLIVNSKDATDPDNHMIATFKITAPTGYILGDLTYDTAFIDNVGRLGISSIAQATVATSFDNNIAIVTVTTAYGTENKFWNFVAKVKNTNSDWVNDTLKSGGDFIIKDMGYTTSYHGSAAEGSTYKLSQLRSWVANLYNGDRGRDWAKYEACNDVNMNTRTLRWGTDTSTTSGIMYERNKLSFYYNSNRSFFLTQSVVKESSIVTNDYSSAIITITDIKVGMVSNVTAITFTYADIPEVDLSKFELKYATSLEDGGDWIYIKPSTITQTETTENGGTVVVTTPAKTYRSDKMGFWRIVYDTTLVSDADDTTITVKKVAPQVIFDKSDLIITSKIVLKSPSGKYFQLNVNDAGDLTTSEYTESVVIED